MGPVIFVNDEPIDITLELLMAELRNPKSAVEDFAQKVSRCRDSLSPTFSR